MGRSVRPYLCLRSGRNLFRERRRNYQGGHEPRMFCEPSPDTQSLIAPPPLCHGITPSGTATRQKCNDGSRLLPWLPQSLLSARLNPFFPVHMYALSHEDLMASEHNGGPRDPTLFPSVTATVARSSFSEWACSYGLPLLLTRL